MISPILSNAAANAAMAQLNSAASSQTLATTGTTQTPLDASALSRLESGGVPSGSAAARTSTRSWGQRLVGGAAGLILGALAMQACSFDPSGTVDGAGGADSGTTGDAGTGAMDGSSSSDSGSGGDGGDGGAMPTGPSALRPTAGQLLPSARAFLLWQDGAIPSGLTVADYQLCSTSGPLSGINGNDECPNETTAPLNYGVLDSLPSAATVRWKVRARFNDGTRSQYSPVQSFQTDASLSAWLRLDEGAGTSAVDSSPLGNDGTLMNAPAWGAGFLGQALTFGPGRLVSVPNAPSLNFAGDFALSAWVRSNATGAHQAILYKGIYSLYKQNSGKLSFFTPGCGIAVSAGDVTPSVWHHVMARRTAGTVALFLDGQMTGNAACADDLTNTAPLAIGCVPGTPSCEEPFDGAIDDVIVTSGSTADPLNDFCAGQALAGVSPLDPSCLP